MCSKDTVLIKDRLAFAVVPQTTAIFKNFRGKTKMDSKTLMVILAEEQEKINRAGLNLDANKEYFKAFFSFPKIDYDPNADVGLFHKEIESRQQKAIEYVKELTILKI
jgi:hypothetical protein